MRRTRKPSITTNCIANRYTSHNERTIEFDSTNGGGLISFFVRDDGTLSVHVYRQDPTVVVTVGKPDHKA